MNVLTSALAKAACSTMIGVAAMCAGSTATAQIGQPHIKTVAAMTPDQRSLFDAAMRIGDESFDAKAKLLIRPPDAHEGVGRAPLIRESTWYALGLLERDGAGDRARAAAILDVVLSEQFLDTTKKWFGTFRRFTTEADPPANARGGFDYDPNWREFVGTTLEVVLEEYPDRLPKGMPEKLYKAVDTAVLGEQRDGRLKPTYSNIALMYGALWDFDATHSGKADEKAKAAAWTDEVYRLFRLHNSFAEYNSPTYLGTDIYALGLWRNYGSNAHIRDMGNAMAATAWTDAAAYYSPALRNISGPYDRSYGMDMETYVTVMGMLIRTVLPAAIAPLPSSLMLGTDHIADIWMAPAMTILGTGITPAALAQLKTFSGPHLVQRQIDDERSAAAWIGEKAIWGGENTGLTRDEQGTSQLHPATLQWRTPSGRIGWMFLKQTPKVNATADEKGLTIETSGTVKFRFSNGGTFTQGKWELPGMTIDVTTDGTMSGSAEPVAVEGVPGACDLTYTGVTKVRLLMHPK